MVGSRIRNPEKTYSGSRIYESKRHQILDPKSESATLDIIYNSVSGSKNINTESDILKIITVLVGSGS